jgi:hypothetical protein
MDSIVEINADERFSSSSIAGFDWNRRERRLPTAAGAIAENPALHLYSFGHRLVH